MHLAYSALSNVASVTPATFKKTLIVNRQKLRYRGYQAACKKYKHEIAVIQQYMPGWQPSFDL